jgi:hypothetical protein
MSQKLLYPGFSAVFIQTFSVHHAKEFILPVRAVEEMGIKLQKKDLVEEHENNKCKFFERADVLKTPIAWVEKRNIENLIFYLPQNSPFEAPPSTKKTLFGKTRRIPMKGNVRRYSLRGFDFKMEIKKKEEDEQITPITLDGHCNVEMSLFFGHTASITYRFLFDGLACSLSTDADTDHVIIFLSTWLNAEHWSQKENDKDAMTTIEYETKISVNSIWFSENGDPLEQGEKFDTKSTWNSFDEIAIRYKNYIYKYCSQFKRETTLQQRKRLEREWSRPDLHGYNKETWKTLSRKEKARLTSEWKAHPFDLERDGRYAMVDIWEDIKHFGPQGGDIFKEKKAGGKLTEAQIINHIRDEHKAELVGLLSLYPEEWPYRDPSAYDEVCGESIAIDTDDLVLAGSSVCVVIGTYGRRGEKVSGVNWKKHLRERAFYHVSWPEYLLIVQMILAKKYIISLATDELIASTLNAGGKGGQESLIKENADLSLRLTRLVSQLDILKYARYPSHKVMYNRTSRRLGLDEDYERLNTLMENVDSSLHNIADYKNMRSDFFLSFVLAVISVASTCELLYQETKMDFLTKLVPKWEDTGPVAAWLIAVVAGFTVFAVGYVLLHYFKTVISMKRSKKHE